MLNELATHVFSVIDNPIEFLRNWQTIIGAFVGAIAPLFVLWTAEKYKERKERKAYLYYLQRIIVDQINSVIEMEDTITKFLDEKLSTLLRNIDQNPTNAYSVDGVFLPLFSVRTIPDDINAKSSGSGYVDNKIARVYAMSKDMPHIMDDIRLQLKDTLDRNEKMSFGKMNSPQVQTAMYKRNIQEYEQTLRNDILGKSIPLYTRKLVETLVAVDEKYKISNWRWVMKFDPKWKFFWKKQYYKKSKSIVMDDMDAYFKDAVEEKMQEISRLKKEKEK